MAIIYQLSSILAIEVETTSSKENFCHDLDCYSLEYNFDNYEK